jgi:hypothetical protein
MVRRLARRVAGVLGVVVAVGVVGVPAGSPASPAIVSCPDPGHGYTASNHNQVLL